MAGTTRLELATSAVTGQRSNQLNYVPAVLYRVTENPCEADVSTTLEESALLLCSRGHRQFRRSLDIEERETTNSITEAAEPVTGSGELSNRRS
jgi:hypothetical protein